MNKRKRQVFGKMERIHSRVKYLGKKRELRKYKRDSRRIWKGILVRYGRYKRAKKRRENV